MAEQNNDSAREQMSSHKSTPRIVIIGAGIAGLEAGECLAKSGFDNFVILEATNRIGGRIMSVDLETHSDVKAELGAHWIHGTERNPIYKLCLQSKLINPTYEGRKLGSKLIFLRENGDPVNTKIVEEVDWTYGMLMTQCEEFYQDHIPTPVENDSVGAFVEREFEHHFMRYRGDDFHLRHVIFLQRMLWESVISGSGTMEDVALSEIGCFQELEGVHYVIPPGFESVIKAIAQALPNNSIQLNQVVTKINWAKKLDISNDYPICVECHNGQQYYADHVIVTCSLGYLQLHYERLFNPPLPKDKVDAIHRIKMGTVNKIILEFDGQLLPDDVYRMELIWDRESLKSTDLTKEWFKHIGSFEVITEKGNVVVAWVTGPAAEYMESISDEQVASTTVELLKKFLQKQSRTFPNLLRVVRSKWKGNPFSLGSYCFIPVGAHAGDIEVLAEPVTDSHDCPLLLFAGEATHAKYYSSSHGALLSGQREAQRLVTLYSH